jgi:hypothetical protein
MQDCAGKSNKSAARLRFTIGGFVGMFAVLAHG